MLLADITATTSVVTAVGGLVVTAFGYVGYQNRRERLAAIRTAFDGVVQALAAEDEKRRLAAAILLRRFFDEESEMGTRTFPHRRAPYAQEALDVMAAVLRSEPTGNLQKLLADGIAFAPQLQDADLQKTNLQNAYLRPRRPGASLRGADFFRADLSGASLKRTSAPGAVFYQARLCRTVLSGADLRDANFFQAELGGARFEEASLRGATFNEARGIPSELREFLDPSGTYVSDQPAPGAPEPEGLQRRIFLSMPSHRSADQQSIVDRLGQYLSDLGFVSEELTRSEYPRFGALGEVKRRMSDCCGAAIFGFGQLLVDEAMILPRTSNPNRVRGAELPTPWNHIEAGMAYTLDLPILVISRHGLADGIFDESLGEHSIHYLPLDGDWTEGPGRASLRAWASAAIERSERPS